jgi:hypothetical protein
MGAKALVRVVVVVVDLVQELAQVGDLGLCIQHALDLLAQALRRPAQMDLEHLADVHAARHAQRVQHDVDGLAVGHVRHVLDRHDGGHHALVAVAAGHLVARLDAALHRQVHLDHLQHAGGEVVALGDLAALVGEATLEFLLVRVDLPGGALDRVGGFVFLHAQSRTSRTSSCRPAPARTRCRPSSRPGRHWRSCPAALRAGARRSPTRGCGTGRRSPS